MSEIAPPTKPRGIRTGSSQLSLHTDNSSYWYWHEHSPFLRLPRRIRDRIYHELLSTTCCRRVATNTDWNIPSELSSCATEDEENYFSSCWKIPTRAWYEFHPAILRVNKQIYEEASLKLYTHNIWMTIQCDSQAIYQKLLQKNAPPSVPRAREFGATLSRATFPAVFYNPVEIRIATSRMRWRTTEKQFVRMAGDNSLIDDRGCWTRVMSVHELPQLCRMLDGRVQPSQVIGVHARFGHREWGRALLESKVRSCIQHLGTVRNVLMVVEGSPFFSTFISRLKEPKILQKIVVFGGPQQWSRNYQDLVTLRRWEEAEEWILRIVEKVIDIGYRHFQEQPEILQLHFKKPQDLAVILLARVGHVKIRQRSASKASEALEILSRGLTLAQQCTKTKWRGMYLFNLSLAYSECIRYRTSTNEILELSKAAVSCFQQAINMTFAADGGQNLGKEHGLRNHSSQTNTNELRVETCLQGKTTEEQLTNGITHTIAGKDDVGRPVYMPTSVHLEDHGALNPDRLFALWEILVDYQRLQGNTLTDCSLEKLGIEAHKRWEAFEDYRPCWDELIPVTSCEFGERYGLFGLESEVGGTEWQRTCIYEPEGYYKPKKPNVDCEPCTKSRPPVHLRNSPDDKELARLEHEIALSDQDEAPGERHWRRKHAVSKALEEPAAVSFPSVDLGKAPDLQRVISPADAALHSVPLDRDGKDQSGAVVTTEDSARSLLEPPPKVSNESSRYRLNAEQMDALGMASSFQLSLSALDDVISSESTSDSDNGNCPIEDTSPCANSTNASEIETPDEMHAKLQGLKLDSGSDRKNRSSLPERTVRRNCAYQDEEEVASSRISPFGNPVPSEESGFPKVIEEKDYAHSQTLPYTPFASTENLSTVPWFDFFKTRPISERPKHDITSLRKRWDRIRTDRKLKVTGEQTNGSGKKPRLR